MDGGNTRLYLARKENRESGEISLIKNSKAKKGEVRLVRGVHILTLKRNFLFRSPRRFALFFSTNRNWEKRHGPLFAQFFAAVLHPMIDWKSA